MKQEHPIARFVGTIISHLILAVLTFWKTLIGVVI